MNRHGTILMGLLSLLNLCTCNVPPPPTDVYPTVIATHTATVAIPTPSVTFEPTVKPKLSPACYQSELPPDIATSYAIQGWQVFAAQADFNLTYFYFPPDCPADSLELDGQNLLYSDFAGKDQVGLVILYPVNVGILGALYQHLISHEYWQMGPEDYPALLEDSPGMNKNLIFLRVDELNGDQTIIGNPLIVLTSLAEHEYIHIAQGRNNPDLANMVWSDKDYQYFIEGYANIGNASSQRYYFETQAAIATLQNLDLMNRGGELQSRIAAALEKQGLDSLSFLAADLPVYDRHIQAFFLRVGGQAYLDGLRQGEISPYLLFTRAGSGDLAAYSVINDITDQ
jgi:hypothetical protein